MRIAVIGTGYVGLVTGTCFAETGNTVNCVDIDKEKVNKLSNGEVTIYEPGLKQLFDRNIQQGRLSFTTDLKEGVKDATIIFLALPTPQGEDGSADLQYVLGIAGQLGSLLQDYTIVVDKSTVPVGTADLVKEAIGANTEIDFDVVSNPEFLREGAAIEDFMKPERVIIGTSSKRAEKIMKTLYDPFVRQGNPLIFMDIRSAELTKYAANAFLATKISFMNEVANICEKVGANIDFVRKGIGSDSRIGRRFLFAGIGYGGSCFPKDVQALAQTSDQIGYDCKIIKAVMDVNTRQKTVLIAQIRDHFQGQLHGKTITFWGLTFKPHTDDMREAPSIDNIEILLKEGVRIKAHDPEGDDQVRKIFGDRIELYENPYQAAEGADAIFIATEWPEFRAPDMGKLSQILKEKVIFDGRNLYDLSLMEENEFSYYSIGRKPINPANHEG